MKSQFKLCRHYLICSVGLVTIALSGCGQKGPLFIATSKAATVVPIATPATPSSPSMPTRAVTPAPVTPTSPAMTAPSGAVVPVNR